MIDPQKKHLDPQKKHFGVELKQWPGTPSSFSPPKKNLKKAIMKKFRRSNDKRNGNFLRSRLNNWRDSEDLWAKEHFTIVYR